MHQRPTSDLRKYKSRNARSALVSAHSPKAIVATKHFPLVWLTLATSTLSR